MMKQILRVCLLLVLVLVGASLLMTSLGRLNPYPGHFLGSNLGLCNGRPCMMGLTLGETPWQDISVKLTEALDYHLEDQQMYIPIKGSTSMNFFQSVDGEHVGRGALYLRSEDETLPIGWIVTWYGDPCGLSYYPRSNNLVVRYPHTLINMRMGTERKFTPYTSARSIHWQDEAYKSEIQPDICVDNITAGAINSAWRGFALPG